MWHYLCAPRFSRFDTIPEWDRHTDIKQTMTLPYNSLYESNT